MNLQSLEQYASREDFMRVIGEEVFANEIQSHGCAQVIVHTFLERLETPDQLASMAASPFFAGLAITGNNCGALIGSLMALGMVVGRQDISQGLPGLLGGVRPMRKLVKAFEEANQNKLDCRAISGVDMASPQESQAYFQAGGLERCAGIMRDCAADAAGLIYDHWQEQAKDK